MVLHFFLVNHPLTSGLFFLYYLTTIFLISKQSPFVLTYQNMLVLYGNEWYYLALTWRGPGSVVSGDAQCCSHSPHPVRPGSSLSHQLSVSCWSAQHGWRTNPWACRQRHSRPSPVAQSHRRLGGKGGGVRRGRLSGGEDVSHYVLCVHL